MNFAIGNINVAVSGKSTIAEEFQKILELVETKDSHVDLAFELVEQLPEWSDGTYFSLDNYNIRENQFRVTEKLFCYELRLSENPVRVLVARKKTDIHRNILATIRKSWKYFSTHGSRAHLRYLRRLVFYVYLPLVELALLKRRSSLAHCSAIEKEGHVVLFPAWGGVGKTSIMSRYIENGWKFLSDDLCVISDNGTASLHPLPMHIYKYHEKQSKELVEKMLLQSDTLDKLLWQVMSRIKKSHKLVRWIKPDKVFGRDKVSGKGEITTVIHMHRHMQSDMFKLKKAEPDEVAKLMASTILDEINNLVNISLVINSCQPNDFIPDVRHLHKRIIDIYSGAFVRAKCYIIDIPQRAMAEDVYSYIQNNRLV